MRDEHDDFDAIMAALTSATRRGDLPWHRNGDGSLDCRLFEVGMVRIYPAVPETAVVYGPGGTIAAMRSTPAVAELADAALALLDREANDSARVLAAVREAAEERARWAAAGTLADADSLVVDDQFTG